MAMMAITTSNSINVNARRRRKNACRKIHSALKDMPPIALFSPLELVANNLEPTRRFMECIWGTIQVITDESQATNTINILKKLPDMTAMQTVSISLKTPIRRKSYL
jgi:hypothetical protein